MTLNSIRKLLFTNRLFESIFINLLKLGVFAKLIYKFVPSNTLYSNNSIRKANRNGINYALDISDYQAWLIYFLCEVDKSLELIHYLGDSKVILDIGGNIGQTALEINKNRKQEKITDFKIVSFEPYSENYVKLEMNIKLNKDIENIKLEKLGLGEKEEHLKMYKDCPTNSGGNRIVHNENQNLDDVEEVQISSLDQYVLDNKIEAVDFIKVDVEGFEYSVLKGGLKTLEKHHPKLYLEFDTVNLEQQGSSAKKMIDLLSSLNYSIKDVEGKFSNEELLTKSVHTDIYCELKR